MEYNQREALPCTSVVFVGQVDSGKSTLLGHSLYRLGCISERELQKFKTESQNFGKSSFCYAWCTDTTKEERERGVTIHGNYKNFRGTKSDITVWDAPGHRDFMKNTLTCIVQADSMVLCVAAAQEEFECSIGPDGSVKNLLIISLSLGIKYVIVAVNKMDSVDYEEKRFVEIEQKLSNMMKKIGWKSENFSFVPVSAWFGDNIIAASNKMNWWNGPTFTQALSDLPVPERLNNHPLRFVIDDSYKIPGIGIVIAGRVSSGTLKPGQVVTLGIPSPSPISVFSLERHHNQLSVALSGMNVGVNIKCTSFRHTDIKRGMVAGDISNYPPIHCKSFSAEVFIINHPGKLMTGYTPIIDCGAAHIACKMTSIICLLSKTKEIIEDSPKFIKKGNYARVIFVPTKPMVVEEYSKFPDVLGRIIIRDGHMVVGVGKVVGIDSDESRPVGILTKAAVRKD